MGAPGTKHVDRRQLHELRHAGLSVEALAARLSCSVQTVKNIIKKTDFAAGLIEWRGKGPVTLAQLRRHIDTMIMPIPFAGCEIWMGTVTPDGYGRIGWGGNLWYLHRLRYEIERGPIPEDLELDHLCRVRSCCNPAHLEPVTRQENLRRGVWASRTRSHCRYGHPLSGGNIRLDGNTRVCRTCNSTKIAAWKAIKRGRACDVRGRPGIAA